MKDTEKREKGKYTITYEIIQDDVTYNVIEVTTVGRDFEIMNFQREYQPPIPYKSHKS